MPLNEAYSTVFGTIPILGMIHLAGDSPVERALEEVTLFAEEGLDGVIVENYHARSSSVVSTALRETVKLQTDLVIGINILPNNFGLAFSLARTYGAQFIQLDYVAGMYNGVGTVDYTRYREVRERNPGVMVLGGVWPKYHDPVTGSDLEADLKVGMGRAEAIVVTGAGTGKETPLDKLMRFRTTLGDHSLIVGAGLTPENAYDQLTIADGAIVGTCLKTDDDTHNPVDRGRVRDLMAVVNEVRTVKLK
jgi:uncharacterized protein